MKTFCFIPLLFLAACSTAPKVALRPQQPPPATDNSAIRYPEVIRAYHVGRYADPNDGLVMHEQHIVYRVEENTRWDLHPATMRTATTDRNTFSVAVSAPHNAAFSPVPVNDAILAEVNAQRLATAKIMVEAGTMSASLAQVQAALQQTRTSLQEMVVLRAAFADVKKRLDALESAQKQSDLPAPSITNDPAGAWSP
jgi:hypothetical protein